MRPGPLLLLGLMLAAVPGHASTSVRVHGVPVRLLAEAGKRTPVRDIDYDQDRCDTRSVDQWLRALAGANARAIAWTGGSCRLVGPGIDSGSRWCAQATVTLADPKSPRDRPVIEVFFEEPVHGRPGVAYAFRGGMQAADGEDLTRFRKDFEADWTSRFPAPPGAIVDCAPGD